MGEVGVEPLGGGRRGRVGAGSGQEDCGHERQASHGSISWVGIARHVPAPGQAGAGRRHPPRRAVIRT